MQPEICDGTTDDSDAILRINAEATPAVSPLDRTEPDILMRACSLFRLLEVDTRVVGYLCAMGRDAGYDGEEFHWFRQQLREKFLYIDQVAVARPFRRMGVGHALCQDLERHALRSGIDTLACEVNYNPVNTESLVFHLKHGFREIGKMATRGIVVTLLAKRNPADKSGDE